jgi:hypothetical protein
MLPCVVLTAGPRHPIGTTTAPCDNRLFGTLPPPQAVVTDPTIDTYLSMTEEDWDTCADNKELMGTVAEAASAKYPQDQFINVFVCGDPGDGSGVLGYAFVPRPPTAEYSFNETDGWRHIFLRWVLCGVEFVQFRVAVFVVVVVL